MAKCYVIDMFLKRFRRGWGGKEEVMRSGNSEEGSERIYRHGWNTSGRYK